jgi:hypothetical protein
MGSIRERLIDALAGDVIASRVTHAVAAVQAAADVRVQEALSVGLSRDDQKNVEQGFRQIGGGTSIRVRDLPPMKQDRMLRIAHWLHESNPMAQWILQTTVDFTLGESVRIDSEDAIRPVVESFWNDPVNQLERRMDTFALEFGMYGELCLPAFINAIDGHVRLGYLDPLLIDDVYLDPNNVLIPVTVAVKETIGSGPKRYLKVIREETNRGLPLDYGLMVGNAVGERDIFTGRIYDGCCFLWQTGKVSNARRGRSDLLALIDWLDGYDAAMFDAMDTQSFFNSFVWDVKLDGFTEEKIREWLVKFRGDIKKNGVFAHNEKVTLTAPTPDMKAADKETFYKTLRSHILGSRAFPEHWYSDARVGLGTAKEQGTPPVKRLSRRQKELRFIMQDMVRFQLHQSIRAGLLPRTITTNARVDAAGNSTAKKKASDQAFSVVLPELSMRDQASIVAAAVSLVAALERAENKGWIRPETAAKLFAAQVSQLGFEIDPDDEYTPGVPGPDAMAPYGDGSMQRILAQLDRMAKGNGDNIGQPKASAGATA